MTDPHDTQTIPTIILDLHNTERNFQRKQIDVLRETCQQVGFFYLRISKEPRDKPDVDVDANTDTDTDTDTDRNLTSESECIYTNIHDLLPRVFEQSRAFFSLPEHIKQRISNPVLNRGYTGMEEETLDPAKQKISGRGDTKEGYYISDDIHETDPRYNPEKLSGPNVWPTKDDFKSKTMDMDADEDAETSVSSFDCQQWKRCMMAYHEEMKQISFQLVQLLARALDLDKHYFDECFQEPMAFLRLLHYSKEKSDVDRGIFACGAHSDYGMITLLATDDTPGLQIFNNDMIWVDVPPPPMDSTTFVVNLGDMMERWTNGKFRSTLHRVVSRGYRERYSIPFFYEPNFDTVVVPLRNCIEEGEVPKYPPTTSGQHLLDKYNETHADFESCNQS